MVWGIDEKNLVAHERAVNLARRYTEQNENDLVMENLYENQDSSTSLMASSPPKSMDRSSCLDMAKHVMHAKNLPAACQKYADVVAYAKSHDMDTAHPTQWLS